MPGYDLGPAARHQEEKRYRGRLPDSPQAPHPGHTVSPQPVSTGIVHVTEGCSTTLSRLEISVNGL